MAAGTLDALDGGEGREGVNDGGEGREGVNDGGERREGEQNDPRVPPLAQGMQY